MINSSSTFIWQGRIHIGDEPGIYGNGHYAGLSMEFPLTIKNFNAQQPIADTIKLEFLTESVAVFAGYLGHLIVVRQYTPDPQPANPYKWKETIVKSSDRIIHGATSTVIDIPVSGSADPIYLSIAIEIDTDVKPGLYDDFLFTGLNYTTTTQNVYLNFGFKE
ncbi:hypothetical protein ACX0G7_16460 [Flavitalea antarctica]